MPSVADQQEPPALDRPRPESAARWVLGVIGAVVLALGILFLVVAWNAVQEIGAMIAVLIGTVLLVGACIVSAITELRVDFWAERGGRDE